MSPASACRASSRALANPPFLATFFRCRLLRTSARRFPPLRPIFCMYSLTLCCIPGKHKRPGRLRKAIIDGTVRSNVQHTKAHVYKTANPVRCSTYRTGFFYCLGAPTADGTRDRPAGVAGGLGGITGLGLAAIIFLPVACIWATTCATSSASTSIVTLYNISFLVFPHFPTGHLSVVSLVLNFIKHPHKRHVAPVKNSHVAQINSRL